MNSTNLTKGLLPLLLVVAIAGCGVTPQEYEDETPMMDMKTYFNGPLQAWGLFQNYREKVVKRFHVDMHAHWQDNKGTLDEHFTYSDGTTQRRIWNLVRIDEHTYSGTADDVIGEAKGVAFGHALRWQYTLALEVDDETYHVKFDDWMYLIDDNTVINRSVMSKFGITLGEVILVFVKPGSSGNPVESGKNNRAPFNMPEVTNINHVTSAIL
jgi:hypothetical protein